MRIHKSGYKRVRKGYCVVYSMMVMLMFICPSLSAQVRKVMNRPYIDQRRIHYGFMAGVHLQDMELQNNGFVDENGNQWFTDIGSYDPGFSVGILGELYLTKHLAARVVPSMHFGTKTAAFRNQLNGETDHQTIKSTYISVPIDLKFSAERFNNYRPYMMCGIDPMLDLTVKKQKNLLLKSFDCYLEVGIGCDFYLPFFKFIPEIKFCYGLMNIIEKNRTDLTDETLGVFTKSVDKARSKMIVISFYFE